MEPNLKSSTDNLSRIKVGFMNIRGQSGLKIEKQLQIEEFVKRFKCDILHLQESNIEDETFSTCNYICSNYNILQNNNLSQYGTSSLVKSEFIIENLRCDTQGRALVFDVGQLTFDNIYFNV